MIIHVTNKMYGDYVGYCSKMHERAILAINVKLNSGVENKYHVLYCPTCEREKEIEVEL